MKGRLQERNPKMTHKKQLSRRVGIVGLGLIGGSLGLDLQDQGWQVHGLVHRSITAERAKARGLANVVSTNPIVLAECDLVILALPMDQLIRPDPSLVKALPENAVITDVGSVKAPVLKIWSTLHPQFVPSHPMAGKASSGVESGLKGLFQNRPWIATPDKATNQDALKTIQNLATSLGSYWLISEADLHDQAVALISHLPVLVSAALLRTIGEEQNQAVLNLAKALASSGFADTTRVGGGNPQLGTSMATTNTEALLKSLASFRWSLEQLEATILARHWSKLEKELEQTKSLRSSFFSSIDDLNSAKSIDTPSQPKVDHKP